MSAPDSRRGPFSRLYGQWLDRLAGAGAGRTQTLVLLCLCERLEFDEHGNASAWFPRAELAERLGVTEKSVSNAASGLTGKGLLSVKKAGHNGRATVYNVFPGIPWPMQRYHAQQHQSVSRYCCGPSVGTTPSSTPKTYKGAGLTLSSPYKTITQQNLEAVRDGTALTREDW